MKIPKKTFQLIEDLITKKFDYTEYLELKV